MPSSLASLSEPSEEPPAQSTAVTPHAPPPLDPQTATLYHTPSHAETFEERRARFNKQETLSFAPVRHRTTEAVGPYPVSRPTSSTDDALTGQVFYIEDIDTTLLPSGWHVDEQGFLQLTERNTDYWEVRAGCLIRHHMVPRRGRLPLHQLPKDCPVNVDKLDKIRVTLVRGANRKGRLYTDDGTDSASPPDVSTSWTGATIYQINGETRKELAMYSGSHQTFTSAKQQGKEQKAAKMQKFKKNKSDVNERLLGPQERAMFKEAKIKELKSFFDHHVWTFQTVKEADPGRTLSSRILLKWSRNPDGTPRAKARLIVRGFADRMLSPGRSRPPVQRLRGCPALWCSPWLQLWAGPLGPLMSAPLSCKAVNKTASSG